VPGEWTLVRWDWLRLGVAVTAPPRIGAGTTSFSDLKVSLAWNGIATKNLYDSTGLTRFKRVLACPRPAFTADCLMMRPATPALNVFSPRSKVREVVFNASLQVFLVRCGYRASVACRASGSGCHCGVFSDIIGGFRHDHACRGLPIRIHFDQHIRLLRRRPTVANDHRLRSATTVSEQCLRYHLTDSWSYSILTSAEFESQFGIPNPSGPPMSSTGTTPWRYTQTRRQVGRRALFRPGLRLTTTPTCTLRTFMKTRLCSASTRCRASRRAV